MVAKVTIMGSAAHIENSTHGSHAPMPRALAFSDGKEWMNQLYGLRFADACFMFADAVLIGHKLAVPKDGQYIILNPTGTDIIEEGDSLLFIAEDDDTYWPDKLQLTNCGAPPEFTEPVQPPTKTLLIGWRRDIQREGHRSPTMLYKLCVMALAASASALTLQPRVTVQHAAAARSSPVVMGAKKEGKEYASLADFLSAPLGGRELLNGSAPDRVPPKTPAEYDTRGIKFKKVEKSGKINPKDASTW